MPDEINLANIYEFQIEIERFAMDFYNDMAEGFEGLQEATDFFISLANDEADHIQILNETRRSISKDQWQLPIDKNIEIKCQTLSEEKDSLEKKIADIRSLNDAYEIAHDFEYSEVNNMFIFLVMEYNSSKEKKKDTITNVNLHKKTLLDFGAKYDIEKRKTILLRE